MSEERKPILCLDFDGVCHSYTSGWKGAAVIPDPPVDGLFEFLEAASEVFEIHVFSSRSRQVGGKKAMKEWFERNLEEWKLTRLVHSGKIVTLHFPDEKPPALVTLDDRAVTFTGKWPSIEKLKNFQPWNKKTV